MSGLRLLPSRAPARVLDPIVRGLAAAGITPNMISIAGVLGNFVAAFLIARGDLAAGGVVMLLASALDMLDGGLARHTGKASDFGALLDSVLDRVSEAAVLFGVLVYQVNQGNREETLLVFLAIVGSLLVSYVRARVEGLGLRMTDGVFTRAERVVLLGVALILGLVRPALWILAVLTLLTAAQRLYIGARLLKEREATRRAAADADAGTGAATDAAPPPPPADPVSPSMERDR